MTLILKNMNFRLRTPSCCLVGLSAISHISQYRVTRESRIDTEISDHSTNATQLCMSYHCVTSSSIVFICPFYQLRVSFICTSIISHLHCKAMSSSFIFMSIATVSFSCSLLQSSVTVCIPLSGHVWTFALYALNIMRTLYRRHVI